MNTYQNTPRPPEAVKIIREAIKREFPKCKFSVTRVHYDSITVALMQAPVSPLFDNNLYTQYGGVYKKEVEGHASLNEHYIEYYDHDRVIGDNDDIAPAGWYSGGYRLTDAGAKMFKRIVEIANSVNYDNSDIQSDYFSKNFYFDLSIGKWDKPFTLS